MPLKPKSSAWKHLIMHLLKLAVGENIAIQTPRPTVNARVSYHLLCVSAPLSSTSLFHLSLPPLSPSLPLFLIPLSLPDKKFNVFLNSIVCTVV